MKGGSERSAALFRLVAASLVVGALTGLVGASFRLALGTAEAARNALSDWSHRVPVWGFLAPVVVAAVAVSAAR